MSFASPVVGALLPGASTSAVQSSPGLAALADAEAPSADGDEFHSMVESSSGAQASGGLMGMMKGVDASRKDAESAILRVGTTGNPSRIYEATATMARFNLQTLVLNKLASKIGQAVDRLTNLQ